MKDGDQKCGKFIEFIRICAIMRISLRLGSGVKHL